jgi:hypothetical protein
VVSNASKRELSTGSRGKVAVRALSPLAVLVLAACTTPILAIDDAMELEDGRTRFVAFVEREAGPLFNGVEGVEVQFLIGGRQVASARSNERGVAMTVAQLSEAQDRFEATARFDGQDFRRSGMVIQWRTDHTLVACDIDATISETSLEALFFEERDDKSTPIPGSLETLRWIDEHFDLVYFTARPRFTLEKTRQWLEAHGYPRAPVLTSLALTDAILEARYKAREIRRLREVFPNLLIGIGNTAIDSEGYGANGMLALILNRDRETHYGAHAIEFDSWDQIRRFFDVNREVLASPERVRAAARGDEMVLVPTLPWAGAAEEQ